MANRYGRDIGRRDRERSGGGGDFGRRSFGSGSRPFGDDERYFGGSRRYGEGYSGQSYRDFDTTDERISGSYGGGYSSDFTESESSEDRGNRDYQGGRYRQGNEYSQGWGGRESGRGRSGGYSGGGESRGYSGRGTSGYDNYGTPRYEDRWGGQGGEDVGRYRSGRGSGYPSSERGYMGGYDDSEERGWLDKTSDEVASWFGDEEAARRRRMDARGTGGHRGRGPTGYSRSDDRIKEDINDRLTDYDYIDATNISVEISGGDVILTGTVDSRYEKRLAEDIAEDVSGVKNVENRLRVNSTTGNFGQTGSTTYETTTTGSTETGTGTNATAAQAKGKSSGT